ncbi:MAG: ribosomal protein S18-alanine N-acetyltransferase [Nitrospiraceae bacterium]
MNKQQAEHVVIESASGGDLNRVLQVEQESFSAPWTRKMFEVELGQNPFGYLYTARLAGENQRDEIIGYVCFWVVFEEFRLMNLAVASSARRQGIGRELLRRALAMGRLQGASRALLEVRASNAAALTLYEHTGFRRTAVREKYYTNPVEDAVLMELDPLRE